MKVGDLVVRTYGEFPRPMAIIVGWYNTKMAEVIWTGTDKVRQFGAEYLEVINESR
jgi:hypothetical protein